MLSQHAQNDADALEGALDCDFVQVAENGYKYRMAAGTWDSKRECKTSRQYKGHIET